MPTIYKVYGDERKWVCASGFFNEDEVYSKQEAQKILKGEPERLVVDVYDIARRTQANGQGHGYDLVCCMVVWRHGKRAVAASDVSEDEKKKMLYGQICVGTYAGSNLRANVAMKAVLTSFASNWQEQLDEAFGPVPYKVDIRTLNGHVFAIGKDKMQIEILPQMM